MNLNKVEIFNLFKFQKYFSEEKDLSSQFLSKYGSDEEFYSSDTSLLKETKRSKGTTSQKVKRNRDDYCLNGC